MVPTSKTVLSCRWRNRCWLSSPIHVMIAAHKVSVPFPILMIIGAGVYWALRMCFICRKLLVLVATPWNRFYFTEETWRTGKVESGKAKHWKAKGWRNGWGDSIATKELQPITPKLFSKSSREALWGYRNNNRWVAQSPGLLTAFVTFVSNPPRARDGLWDHCVSFSWAWRNLLEGDHWPWEQGMPRSQCPFLKDRLHVCSERGKQRISANFSPKKCLCLEIWLAHTHMYPQKGSMDVPIRCPWGLPIDDPGGIEFWR